MAALVDRRTIPFVHWQHKLGLDVSALGEIVASYEDLEQSIATIVLTQKGTVPLAPEKCTDLLPWIDRAPAIAIPNFTREIWDAITTFEPRVVVTSVTPKQVDFSQWRFPVFWYPRADVSRQIRMTEVPYAPS